MNQNLIWEYNQVLLGRQKTIPAQYFDGDAVQNESLALDVLRYVIECHLRWTPEEMRYKFDQTVIDLFKLSRILSYVQFPPEADKDTDFFVYAHKLYPNRVPIDSRSLTILMYNKVLSGLVSKYPKGFFGDDRGQERACICLHYVLSQRVAFGSLEELYAAFIGDRGARLLRTYKLEVARRNSWQMPVDFLHDALPEEDKEDVLYHYYLLRALMPKAGCGREPPLPIVSNC